MTGLDRHNAAVVWSFHDTGHIAAWTGPPQTSASGVASRTVLSVREIRFYAWEGALRAPPTASCDSFAIKPACESNPERASTPIFVVIVS